MEGRIHEGVGEGKQCCCWIAFTLEKLVSCARVYFGISFVSLLKLRQDMRRPIVRFKWIKMSASQESRMAGNNISPTRYSTRKCR